MARWRTLNKRARRRRERDAEIVRNLDKVLVPALEAIAKDAFKAALVEFVKSMNRVAEAWAKSGADITSSWGPLDPKYARSRRRVEQWPDVVLEDVLDAEYITEE